MMKPPEKTMIYNLFPLLCGPASAWAPHLERAADMGFNWIFVNSIQQPGGSGSLYAVADYFDINPALIDPSSADSAQEQIRSINARARDLGLRMMVDLVINHCSADSLLLKDHPEWFLWENPGRVTHPAAWENGKKVVWGDLAKFNHEHTVDFDGLCNYFSEVMSWLIDLGFEGFRCDAAYQVPARVWERLIGEKKAQHNRLVFFAETLGCTPQQTRLTASSGFDFVFNSAKWWDYRQHWLMQQYQLSRGFVPSVAFPESHDTPRLCGELNGNMAGVKQRYAFSALFSAGMMMPIGFEFGFRRKVHVVETTPEDWEPVHFDLTGFIRKVNELKMAYEIFQEEAAGLILSERRDPVLVLWKGAHYSQQEALVILNKDIEKPQPIRIRRLNGLVQTDTPLLDVSPEAPMTEIPEPFHLELAPGQVLVLVAK